MQFGFSVIGMSQQPRGVDMVQNLQDIIAWVHRARDLGFDYVYMGQHYLTSPYQMYQAVPLLSRLAAETGEMKLLATLVVTLHNPVDLAETLATLDVISGGRLMLSAALGYRDEEYAAFGVDPRTRVSRMQECLHLLLRLWTEDNVTFHGKHFHLERATTMLKPVQKPHPPVWIAANADAAIVRAARLGLPWNINPHATYTTIARQVALYRQAAREAGKDPDVKLPMSRELYCAPNREQALDEAAPYLHGKYQAYAQWGQEKALPGKEDFRVSFEELARDRFVVGSPEDCVREVERYAALGIGYMHFRMAWPRMPVQQAVRSMELVAAHVVPRFRDR